MDAVHLLNGEQGKISELLLYRIKFNTLNWHMKIAQYTTVYRQLALIVGWNLAK